MKDVIEDFYDNTPYPDTATYLGFSPDTKKDLAVPEDEDYTDKLICIAGCGTTQAFLVGNQLPKAKVIGCDVSEKSLKYAQSLLNKYKISNVQLYRSSFEDFDCKNASLVLASGVMHHTKDRIAFMNKAYEVLHSNGRFRGMVYNIEGRKGIRELSNFFIENNFTVHDVRQFFEKNQFQFYDNQSKVDVEIKDTWLNPRFHEYTVATLDAEFNMSNWKNCKRGYQVIPTKTQIYFEFKKA